VTTALGLVLTAVGAVLLGMSAAQFLRWRRDRGRAAALRDAVWTVSVRTYNEGVSVSLVRVARHGAWSQEMGRRELALVSTREPDWQDRVLAETFDAEQECFAMNHLPGSK
jgi:hypothetical protein